MSHLRSRVKNRMEMLEARRLLSAGDLDPTFGVDGRFVGSPTEPPGFLLPTDLAVQADGKLLYSGFGVGDVGSVVRVNVNGSVDASFGDRRLAYSGCGPYIADVQEVAFPP